MKKYWLPIIFFMILIPFYVNAEEYYVDNLNVDQELECGDILHPRAPSNLITNNENTIANTYGKFSNMYGHTFYFIDEYLNFNNQTILCSNGGLQCDNRVIILCFPEVNEKKWIIDQVVVNNNLEYADLYLKAVLKKPKISINNQVNGNDKYIAKKDEILKYSIIIKNTGDGKSTDNIVIANVPDGLLILEDQISDNGIYDKENNTVTWNYELLGVEEEYTFNYYAKVVKDNVTEYISKAYITSSQVQEKTESDDTIVNIENKISVPDTIKNPNTGTGIFIVISIIILIISSSIYWIMKKEKIIY